MRDAFVPNLECGTAGRCTFRDHRAVCLDQPQLLLKLHWREQGHGAEMLMDSSRRFPRALQPAAVAQTRHEAPPRLEPPVGRDPLTIRVCECHFRAAPSTAKDLPTAFLRSAKNRRTRLGPTSAPSGLGPPEFRVSYVIRTKVSRFKFDDRTVKFKQEILNNAPPRRSNIVSNPRGDEPPCADCCPSPA
jgi:hypothetical protein